MKPSFVGLSGYLYAGNEQRIVIKSIQADVTDPSATDISVSLSGSLGTEYYFGAVVPVITELNFLYDEDITIASSGSSLNTVVINYIQVGDQTTYMTANPNRINRPQIGKWKL